MTELKTLQNELKTLPKEQKLALAHWLLDSLAGEPTRELPLAEMADKSKPSSGPLSEWVGIFSGGPGDTAERDEEILEAEIDAISGWGGK